MRIGRERRLERLVSRNAFALTFTAMALVIIGVNVVAGSPAGHHPVTHRLQVTPSTVAYGYYWAGAAPVLRIDSGDILDVDTLLTNTPEGTGEGGPGG